MQVVETFLTAAPAELIWRVLADVSRWKEWTPTILDITPLGANDLQIGARYRISQPGFKPAEYEVTACIVSETFTWAQKMPGGGLFATHALREKGALREVELSFFSRGMLAGAASIVLSAKIREFVATEARCLKKKVEHSLGS